jgi:hypothetical protein
MVIVILYYNCLLPYILNRIENEIPEEILKRLNYLSTEEQFNSSQKLIQNCINISNLTKPIIFGEINYTNNSIYREL